jgi:hypothetical protein
VTGYCTHDGEGEDKDENEDEWREEYQAHDMFSYLGIRTLLQENWRGVVLGGYLKVPRILANPIAWDPRI